MDDNRTDARTYLFELYQMTGGNISTQVSMFDVGTAIGLERSTASKIAEDLIGDGLVEVKTLSGGIGITVNGIECVEASNSTGTTPSASAYLGKHEVLEEEGHQAVTSIVKEIQSQISHHNVPYDQIEELVIDLKTIEVQLLSPRPKTAILREVLHSLKCTLDTTGHSKLSEDIERMISH